MEESAITGIEGRFHHLEETITHLKGKFDNFEKCRDGHRLCWNACDD